MLISTFELWIAKKNPKKKQKEKFQVHVKEKSPNFWQFDRHFPFWVFLQVISQSFFQRHTRQMLSLDTSKFSLNKERILKLRDNNLMSNYFAINNWMQNFLREHMFSIQRIEKDYMGHWVHSLTIIYNKEIMLLRP